MKKIYLKGLPLSSWLLVLDSWFLKIIVFLYSNIVIIDFFY